jgi:hypothetical protein
MSQNENMREIPAKAWEGVDDSLPDTKQKCPLCGSSNTKVLSMSEMMHLPRWQVINENTFMIPNVMWGYVQCFDCESKRQPPAPAQPVPWWKQLFSGGAK